MKMGITKKQFGGAVAVICGIFLFKALSYAPGVESLLKSQYVIIAILMLLGILFHDAIAGLVIKD